MSLARLAPPFGPPDLAYYGTHGIESLEGRCPRNLDDAGRLDSSRAGRDRRVPEGGDSSATGDARREAAALHRRTAPQARPEGTAPRPRQTSGALLDRRPRPAYPLGPEVACAQ